MLLDSLGNLRQRISYQRRANKDLDSSFLTFDWRSCWLLGTPNVVSYPVVTVIVTTSSEAASTLHVQVKIQ